MGSLCKKWFGDKAFYKTVAVLVLPIILQNFITNFVGVLDNIMVGKLGTEQMSAVYIINQLLFVFNLALFGAVSGVGIFTAQYYGKKDADGIRYTVRFKLAAVLTVTVIGTLLLLFFGDFFINLYLHDGSYDCDLQATFAYAKEYLGVIIFELALLSVTQVIAGTLRETGESLVPMLAGFAAVLVNCLFNYFLIFGKCGFPELGVKGAALATLLSRIVETGILVVYILVKRARYEYFFGLFGKLKVSEGLLGLIFRKGVPLMLNEFLWSVGIALLSVAFSNYGVEIVAGYGICSSVMNLFSIAILAFGTAIGILVGNKLGEGKFDEAIDVDRKLTVFSLFLSVVLTALTIVCAPFITSLYETTEAAREYAVYFIIVSALLLPATAFVNAAYFTLRCGGRTGITFLFDSVYVLTLQVPAAFLLCVGTSLSVRVTYALVYSIDILKALIGFILVKKRIWVNSIVSS